MFFKKPIRTRREKILKDSSPVKEPSQSQMMPENLKSIFEIFKSGEEFLEIVFPSLGENSVENVPDSVEN
jgi:hypothetical protein